MDYSGESINEKSEKGIAQHIMKCIETGSNPAFTFTYDDSSKLLQTNYNNYYYTYYQRWLSDVKSKQIFTWKRNRYYFELSKNSLFYKWISSRSK